MILIISHKQDGHADVVCAELTRIRSRYIRFSLEDYPQQLRINYSLETSAKPHFVFQGTEIDFSSIKSVWFRRPGYPVYDSSLHHDVLPLVQEETERFTNSFWYLIDGYWMSRPEYIYYAEHKPLQMRVAQQLGWRIPATLITNDPICADAFYHEHGRDIIIKPLSRSWIDWHENNTKREQVFYTTPVDAERANYLQAVQYCPTFLQERVKKDFELRITVVGDQIFACKIESQNSLISKDDWRKYDIDNTPHTKFKLPSDIEQLCINLTSQLGLNFGAIDVIVTPSGEFVLCEINPSGQWYWIEGLTGLKITSAIAAALTNRTNIAVHPLWAI